MNLRVQKRVSARILGCSPSRVVFDETRLEEIKEAITRRDLKSLISEKAIIKKPVKSISQVRTRKKKKQKSKGKQKGPGSRKGKETARSSRKRNWINKIRLQRQFLASLKKSEMIDNKTRNQVIAKVKGGFFRSKKHLQIYLNENNLIIKKKKE